MQINEQVARLGSAKLECDRRINASHASPLSNASTASPRCETVWDNILCWDAALPNTVQRQPCPEYIHDFNPNEMAIRYCTPNGTWFNHPKLNKSWTNYTACHEPPNLQMDTEHGERLKLIQIIGYGVSLCSLVLAVIIMCCSRRLKSKSNNLHVNLFLAFILRAGLSFLKKVLFVHDLALEKDIKRLADGRIVFMHDGPHWECRLLYTVFMYSICVSQMWIFVEGLYLHMLIYRTLTTERNGVKPYIVLGWALPFAVVVPWIIVKFVADNEICWNMSTNAGYIWIINGPMLATVLLNFFFFLNISRVLCSRLRSSQRHMGRAKYRQLAKFILVLIPLFGVFYIALTVAFPLGYANRFDITPMYVEQTYNAFQGFLLALLFCFLNEEVHSEIRGIWYRRTRRRDSVATRSFVLSSFKRGSYHNRASLSAGQPLRSATRLSCSESFDAKRESWSTRLKRRVLRFLGRSHKDRNLVRPPTPPFIVRHNCSTESRRLGDGDDLELSRKLRDKNDDEHDMISSG